MSDPAEVAKAFTDFYYKTFDNNRGELHQLYRPNSMLSFQDQNFLGVDAIRNKFTDLPFQKVTHHIASCLAQPSVDPNSIIVSVAGYLVVDEDTNPLGFSQVFQLVPEGVSYYVHNDIFSLNVG